MALCVGGMVCIAAANAGATSQDLKTGFLVGATPRAQQLGLVIGCVTAAAVIGITVQEKPRTMASDRRCLAAVTLGPTEALRRDRAFVLRYTFRDSGALV